MYMLGTKDQSVRVKKLLSALKNVAQKNSKKPKEKYYILKTLNKTRIVQ